MQCVFYYSRTHNQHFVSDFHKLKKINPKALNNDILCFTKLGVLDDEKNGNPPFSARYLHFLAFSRQSFIHFIIKYFAQKRGNPLFSGRISSFSSSLDKVLHILLSNILLKKEEISWYLLEKTFMFGLNSIIILLCYLYNHISLFKWNVCSFLLSCKKNKTKQNKKHKKTYQMLSH